MRCFCPPGDQQSWRHWTKNESVSGRGTAYYCGCISLSRNVVVVIICHSPEVATGDSSVVGLGRVSDGVILTQKNALLLQRRESLGGSSIIVVGIFKPNLQDAVMSIL